MAALVAEETGRVVIVKLALVLPAPTVTWASTVAAPALPLERVTNRSAGWSGCRQRNGARCCRAACHRGRMDAQHRKGYRLNRERHRLADTAVARRDIRDGSCIDVQG